MIIPYFILKKEIRTKDDIKKIQDNGIVPFKYIFNNYSEEFSKKDKLYFILFGILKLILDISYILYQHLVEEDYSIFKSFTYSFQFELIFLFLLSKLIYKKQFYKHQYISIIILAILGLSRVIVEYIVNETDNFFINLIIQIVYSFFKALMIVYVKGLMKFKYISPYKVCFLFGLFNLIIITIAFIIVSFIPCYYNYYCKAEYNGKKYFANILAIFNISGLFIFILAILKAILLILNYITINYFTVFHCFLFIHITEILDIGSYISLHPNSLFYLIFTFVIFLGFGAFFILLFLEIIELNICGMGVNTIKNIEKWAFLDKEKSVILENESLGEEESAKTEELFGSEIE